MGVHHKLFTRNRVTAIREQRVFPGDIRAVEGDLQIKRFFPVVARALVIGQNRRLRDCVRDRRCGQRLVHAGQQKPLLGRDQGTALETPTAAAAPPPPAAAQTKPEQPGREPFLRQPEQRFRERVCTRFSVVSRPTFGGGPRLKPPSKRTDNGLGKHKLAIVVGCDAFACQGVWIETRRSGAVAIRQRQRVASAKKRAPFRLDRPTPPVLDHPLHRPFKLR
mmetsp:Transcript_10538/g.39046  ORF Transcript_10538/g.39046 Transcript_10538/m.39046 type:complete len:221 (+) Transcript_10538:2280-2942(+)